MRDKTPIDISLDRTINQVGRVARTQPGAQVAFGFEWRAVGRLERPNPE